ncbi:Bacterial ABC transporter protein EcsB [compost metagenome]
MMELKALYQKRKHAFWGKVLPFFPYVLQSGVAVLLLLSLIAFSAWYTTFLTNLPHDFPVRLIVFFTLALFTAHAGFRTYLRDADVVLLMPQESNMKQYLLPARIRGVVYKLLGLFLITIILWPLVMISKIDMLPLWVLLLLLALLKSFSGYAYWQEVNVISPNAKRWLQFLRWGITILLLAVWIWQPIWKSAIFTLLLLITYLFVLRIPMKHRLAWENLIAVEKAAASRVMLILSWFVDVQADGQKVVHRPLLSGIGQRIPWKKELSYKYLLQKTLIRSELLAIVFRLWILGTFLVVWSGGSWLGTAVYLLFVFLIGAQLTSLRQVHEDSPAVQYYPIPEGVRKNTVISVIISFLMTISFVMWLPMLFVPTGDLAIKLSAIILGGLLILGMRASWIRKWKEEEEE